MDDRSQLLSTIEKWHAFRSKATSVPESNEWKTAHAHYENALHAAGVYKEALRGQRALSEDVRTQTEEPERTYFLWAYKFACHRPEALKALHKEKTHSGRTAILDGLQAAFNKAELKKVELRKAACQRRTEALVAESRAEAEQSRSQKEREQNHKAVLVAEAVVKAFPKQSPLDGKQ